MEDTEILSVDDLVAYYDQINTDQNLLVGIEWERSGVYRDTFAPVPYYGDSGYNAILHKLVEELGWVVLKSDGEHIYQIKRGGAKIDIEADGRLELAGSPQKSLHDLSRELKLHNHEVLEVGNIYGVRWVSIGQQPMHANEEISIIEKEYYKVMQRAFPNILKETMSKKLNGITSNLSYLDEKDAIRKAQTAFRATPIIAAMFAASPFNNGEVTLFLDQRRHTIHNHAPGRTGVPENILSEDFSFESWINYYLALPVIVITDQEKILHEPKNLTFKEWIDKGYKGIRPKIKDFDFHIKTTWSDIRLRPSYLEYRVADSTPFQYIMSLPAMMKGLLFDEDGCAQVEQLTKSWTYQDIIDLDQKVWKTGLLTEIKGKTLLTYAQKLIIIANEKLHDFNNRDARGRDESYYLNPLKKQIFIKEKSLSQEMLDLYATRWNKDLTHLLRWCERFK